MTTQHRRTPSEQAASILRDDLRRREARAAKSRAVWERDEAECERTRKMLAMLGMEPLPGFEPPAAALAAAADLALVLQSPMPCQWDEIPHAHRELRDGTLECVEEKP